MNGTYTSSSERSERTLLRPGNRQLYRPCTRVPAAEIISLLLFLTSQPQQNGIYINCSLWFDSSLSPGKEKLAENKVHNRVNGTSSLISSSASRIIIIIIICSSSPFAPVHHKCHNDLRIEDGDQCSPHKLLLRRGTPNMKGRSVCSSGC